MDSLRYSNTKTGALVEFLKFQKMITMLSQKMACLLFYSALIVTFEYFEQVPTERVATFGEPIKKN